MPDGDQHIVESVSLPDVVMHVSRGDDRDPRSICDIRERSAALAITSNLVALQLDEELVRAENVPAFLGPPSSRSSTLLLQNRRQQPVPAPRKADETAPPLRERVETQPWIPSILLTQVGLRQQSTQIAVPLGTLREQRNMCAIEQRDLRADDRLYIVLPGALGKRHRPVESIVVRQRKRAISKVLCLKNELFRKRRAVQKRKRGVTM